MTGQERARRHVYVAAVIGWAAIFAACVWLGYFA